jgi:predicted TPR repeat methyltransferase
VNEDRGGGQRWKEIWARRSVDVTDTDLAGLLSADGYDSGFAGLTVQAWKSFVESRMTDLGVERGSSMFEVGCGAGAFVLEPHRRGVRVGGIDLSPQLIEIARNAMPDGEFGVQEADQFAVTPKADFVVSCSVFEYFNSLEYAADVIDRMSAKAARAVAVFDVPDLAKREAAIDFRRASMGPEEYDERYAGLHHCYYERDWFKAQLEKSGLDRVTINDQDLDGYGNAPFRFNAWGFKV